MNDQLSLSLVVEKDLPQPPEKVWRALTESTLIAEWLMDNDFEPVVGHRFSFRMAPQGGWSGVIESEVLAVEPHSRLEYAWKYTGETPEPLLPSTVTFTLRPTDSGTHLRMEQTGFRSKDTNEYKGAQYGWANFLGKLDGVVAGL